MAGPLGDQADARALAGCGRGGDDVGRALVEAGLERLAHLLAAHVGGVHPPAGELGVETADALGRVVEARTHLVLAHSPRCRPHYGRKSIENGGRSKAPTVKKRTELAAAYVYDPGTLFTVRACSRCIGGWWPRLPCGRV